MEDFIRTVTDAVCTLHGRGDVFRITGLLFQISLLAIFITGIYLYLKEKNRRAKLMAIFGILTPILFLVVMYFPYSPSTSSIHEFIWSGSYRVLFPITFLVYGYNAFFNKNADNKLWKKTFIIVALAIIYIYLFFTFNGVCVEHSAGGYPFIDHWTQKFKIF